jgi:DNA invertase Pin-like site-specific DNA recombinase
MPNARPVKPSLQAKSTKDGPPVIARFGPACSCAMYTAQEQRGGLKEMYNDGGFSGATIERPAFQRLLADVGKGRIDVVVVYKVDRLTRSHATIKTPS